MYHHVVGIAEHPLAPGNARCDSIKPNPPLNIQAAAALGIRAVQVVPPETILDYPDEILDEIEG